MSTVYSDDLLGLLVPIDVPAASLSSMKLSQGYRRRLKVSGLGREAVDVMTGNKHVFGLHQGLVPRIWASRRPVCNLVAPRPIGI